MYLFPVLDLTGEIDAARMSVREFVLVSTQQRRYCRERTIETCNRSNASVAR
jgi:hypothetical protein